MGSDQQQSDHDAIVAVVSESQRAFDARDEKALRACYAEDFTGFTPYQRELTIGIDKFISACKRLFLLTESTKTAIHLAQIQIYGDYAISSAFLQTTATARGRTEESLGKFTQVLCRQEGQWKIVHENLSYMR